MEILYVRVTELHPLKRPVPTVVTDAGISGFWSDEQDSNAPFPIVFRFF